MRFTQRQRGVTLIEVLITLVVLMIGFLATGSMQSAALRSSQAAFHQGQAVLILSAQMDRMRANPEGLRTGLYDDLSTATAEAAPHGCSTAGGCSAADRAKHDLALLKLALDPDAPLSPLLPPRTNGSAAVGTISLPVDGSWTLTIVWGAQDADGAAEDHSASLVFAL